MPLGNPQGYAARPIPWWRNFLDSPGAGQVLGTLGSQFLAAPNLSQALAGLGQVPGQLAQLSAQEELAEAERRRQELEERLANLRIQKAELEAEALPEQLAAQKRAGELGELQALFGMGQAARQAREERGATQARQAFGESIPGSVGGLVATDPTLARQVGAAQAASMIPRTESEILNDEYKRAQITNMRRGMEAEEQRLEFQKGQVEQQTRRAELQIRQRAAAEEAEGWRRHVEAIEKQLQETSFAANDEAKTTLEEQRDYATRRFTEAQNALRGLAAQERTAAGRDSLDLEVVMADLMATMSPDEAQQALMALTPEQRQQFEQLLQQGMSPRQALQQLSQPMTMGLPVSSLGGLGG